MTLLDPPLHIILMGILYASVLQARAHVSGRPGVSPWTGVVLPRLARVRDSDEDHRLGLAGRSGRVGRRGVRRRGGGRRRVALGL